ncbi:hypothetical protein GLOTRDRAFT_112681 [Gloeophyllum trabeum ATCC 11539]|uniref:Uncharacterized protein n=1 Tax=Gloeophyllum trabeum (strain ATCC 11539 / FP-39264 / Madison 617) TaxID=670483 RepID=S7PTM8_GLOTA|nr:uncharacterized protein GLOTRDRAFT_112681 [Gloeophyllum trabeum ATCC 11539]EPQ50682.1 hypothetical protein GLOTRDRAFT_112681 [Gloeophyllum trabeum ATCC 11539]
MSVVMASSLRSGKGITLCRCAHMVRAGAHGMIQWHDVVCQLQSDIRVATSDTAEQ